MKLAPWYFSGLLFLTSMVLSFGNIPEPQCAYHLMECGHYGRSLIPLLLLIKITCTYLFNISLIKCIRGHSRKNGASSCNGGHVASH